MDLFEGTKVYYIRVLIYLCGIREDMRKVNVNRDEGIHKLLMFVLAIGRFVCVLYLLGLVATHCFALGT